MHRSAIGQSQQSVKIIGLHPGPSRQFHDYGSGYDLSVSAALGNDTTGYGNWKQYYRIPFDGNRTMRLVLDGGDDPGPREYLILHDEHGKIVRYIEIAAEYGDGPRSKKYIAC